MILDLDGATTEPSRRRHVAMLSAVAAAVSLGLLIALFAPAPRTATAPLGAATTGSTARMVLSASGETAFVRLGQIAPQRDDETMSFCVAGIGSSPPVHLVLERSGRLIAAYTSGTTGRFIPLPQAYVVSGWLTVPCDTSDVFAPRLNRAR